MQGAVGSGVDCGHGYVASDYQRNRQDLCRNLGGCGERVDRCRQGSEPFRVPRAGKHVVLDVEGDINATSKQDERNYNSSGGGWDVSAGVAIQNRTLVAPVGSAGFNFNTEHDNSRLTNDGAAGVVASDGLTGHVKGDANLTGATIADLSDKGNLRVDGAVNAQNLKDYRDKDGGSGGLNVGISSTTLAPTVGVAFGRVAGEDYQAEQRATIDVGQSQGSLAPAGRRRRQGDPQSGRREGHGRSAQQALGRRRVGILGGRQVTEEEEPGPPGGDADAGCRGWTA